MLYFLTMKHFTYYKQEAGEDKRKEGMKWWGMVLLMVLSLSCVWRFATPRTITARLLCPWDSPVKNTGVGCHFFLQGIFWPRDGTHVSCIGRQTLNHVLLSIITQISFVAFGHHVNPTIRKTSIWIYFFK